MRCHSNAATVAAPAEPSAKPHWCDSSGRLLDATTRSGVEAPHSVRPAQRVHIGSTKPLGALDAEGRWAAWQRHSTAWYPREGLDDQLVELVHLVEVLVGGDRGFPRSTARPVWCGTLSSCHGLARTATTTSWRRCSSSSPRPAAPETSFVSFT